MDTICERIKDFTVSTPIRISSVTQICRLVVNRNLDILLDDSFSSAVLYRTVLRSALDEFSPDCLFFYDCTKRLCSPSDKISVYVDEIISTKIEFFVLFCLPFNLPSFYGRNYIHRILDLMWNDHPFFMAQRYIFHIFSGKATSAAGLTATV